MCLSSNLGEKNLSMFEETSSGGEISLAICEQLQQTSSGAEFSLAICDEPQQTSSRTEISDSMRQKHRQTLRGAELSPAIYEKLQQTSRGAESSFAICDELQQASSGAENCNAICEKLQQTSSRAEISIAICDELQQTWSGPEISNCEKLQHTCIGAEISDAICEKLADLPNSHSEYCIYRVHNQLRMANEEAYDPKIIAIGPYHRGNESLKMMEKHKLRYLQSLLERRKENVEVYVEAVRSLEDKARKCYAELPELTSHEFIEMLVLDGCFIVELFRKFSKPFLRENDDPIFIMDWMMKSLQRDLMLFENQIPFFVLFELFNMTGVPDDRNFINLAISFFYDLFPGDGLAEDADENWHDETKHLLGLIHDNWLPPFAGLEVPHDMLTNRENWRLIHCASELREAGVSFVEADQETCLLDIQFRNGTLHIPQLVIEDRTECFFWNLIAYEQYCQHIHRRHVIGYGKFLGCLIDSPKDVEILRRYGILDSWLGDDEAVSEIFNKINHTVTDPRSHHFHYIGIFNKVNAHCSRRVNRLMSSLRRNNLSSPWVVISILAAFVLLLLSFTWTLYARLSYRGK